MTPEPGYAQGEGSIVDTHKLIGASSEGRIRMVLESEEWAEEKAELVATKTGAP